jgi:nucleoside-diphosphate-sugar epimerase
VKVFVTGSTGFIGAHLVRALVARGDTVTCLVRSPAKAARLGWRDVRVVRGSLNDAGALEEGCRDADVIYHVAGALAARNPAAFMHTNRDATARLIEIAGRRNPTRFVFVSSQAAGGPNPRGEPIDEGHPPRPVTSYGRSKLAAEEVVRGAGIPWTIVRPPVVYGEGDRELLKIFKLAATGVAPVFGDGRQELSIVYAGDLADALVTVATAQDTANRLYYVAHPEPTTSGDLVRAIAAARGRRVRLVPLPHALARGVLWLTGGVAAITGRATLLSTDKAPEFFAPAWTCRPDAMLRDAGWRARVDLDTGLRRTMEWYRAERWL